MKISQFALVALLPLAACATNTPAAMVATPAISTPALNNQDVMFMTAAAQSDAFEIQSSQLALEKSRNPAIKAFAQRMVNEHGATSQKMMQSAQVRGITMPPASVLDPMQTEKLDMLKAANGRTFDREYIMDQIAGHRMTASMLQTEIDTGSDHDNKALASAELPMVQDHLRAAERLRMRRY